MALGLQRRVPFRGKRGLCAIRPTLALSRKATRRLSERHNLRHFYIHNGQAATEDVTEMKSVCGSMFSVPLNFASELR